MLSWQSNAVRVASIPHVPLVVLDPLGLHLADCLAARQVFPGWSAYIAAKHGVHGLTRAAALELGGGFHGDRSDIIADVSLEGLTQLLQLFPERTNPLSCGVILVHAGESERQPEKQLIYAERWNFALATALNPGNDAASLPRIEDTVERVWRQTNGSSKNPKGPAGGADQ